MPRLAPPAAAMPERAAGGDVLLPTPAVAHTPDKHDAARKRGAGSGMAVCSSNVQVGSDSLAVGLCKLGRVHMNECVYT